MPRCAPRLDALSGGVNPAPRSLGQPPLQKRQGAARAGPYKKSTYEDYVGALAGIAPTPPSQQLSHQKTIRRETMSTITRRRFIKTAAGAGLALPSLSSTRALRPFSYD
jgi:hypothetical protein